VGLECPHPDNEEVHDFWDPPDGTPVHFAFFGSEHSHGKSSESQVGYRPSGSCGKGSWLLCDGTSLPASLPQLTEKGGWVPPLTLFSQGLALGKDHSMLCFQTWGYHPGSRENRL
jgi:hypothetical protein